MNHQFVDGVDVPRLVSIGTMIERTVDFDQSQDRQRSAVKAGVDPQLDEIKRRYDGMESFLTEVVNQLRQELPEWARQYVRSCIFLPQLGFLLVVEPGSEIGSSSYEGEGLGDDRWDKMFIAEGGVCYKNARMKELDKHYGDMYCEIGGIMSPSSSFGRLFTN